MQNDYDLIIVGAGLAGNCLALALKDSGLRIAVVEAFSRERLEAQVLGDRALALAAGTVRLLHALGAWDGVADKASPIAHIHVSDRGHFGKTRLAASDYGVEAFGYVINARDLETHLSDLVAQTACEYLYDTRVAGLMSGQDAVNVSLRQGDRSLNLAASLLVGADGGQSSVRKLLDIPQRVSDYGQTALVTTVQTSLPHHGTAYERFTEQGPLALLPSGERRLAVVWTRRHEEADALMAGGEAAFLQALQQCFGYRLGALKLVAPCRAFPLSLIRAERMVDGRVVIIGNAVHQLHPVAGQGFNLGMRDVAALADDVLDQRQARADLGDAALLNRYAQRRQQDHDRTIGFTNNLVQIFSNEWLPVAAVRNAGLAVLDHLPFAKKSLVRHAMGLAQPFPKWIQR